MLSAGIEAEKEEQINDLAAFKMRQDSADHVVLYANNEAMQSISEAQSALDAVEAMAAPGCHRLVLTNASGEIKIVSQSVPICLLPQLYPSRVPLTLSRLTFTLTHSFTHSLTHAKRIVVDMYSGCAPCLGCRVWRTARTERGAQ